MAIYHLSVKTVSRSSGRSAVAAAAYRSGTCLTNARDGLVHDYSRRGGVEAAFIVAPEGAAWAQDREALWNAAEAAEARKDAKVAREYELALPHELGPGERRELVEAFARAVAERFGVAADAAIHAPDQEGDKRNWHAHVLTTTRAATAEGLGAKTRALDVKQSSGPLIEGLRETWAEQVNAALERVRAADRVDHRSFARQGAERLATQHLGVAAMALERRAAREQEQAAARPASGSEAGAERAAAEQPVTRIGRHNALVRERNALLERARQAWEAARTGLEALERAAEAGASWVRGLARGLGAQVAAEREAAERTRQQEQAREAELRRRERDRDRGYDRGR